MAFIEFEAFKTGAGLNPEKVQGSAGHAIRPDKRHDG